LKNIIVVLPSQPNKVQTFIRELLHRKHQIEDNFRLIFIYPSAFLSIAKTFSLFRLWLKPLRLLKYFRSLKSISLTKKLWRVYLNSEILVENNVEAIHYLFANNAIGKLELSDVLGAKTSIGLRGYDITFYPLNHLDSYNSHFWSKIDSIQYNSDDLYKWALIWGANPHTDKTKITAAVNNHFIINENEVNVKTDITTVKLIFVGRLHWKKGIDSLFRAMELLRKDGIDFSFDIIGDGPEMEKCRFMVKLLALENKVVFHGELFQQNIIYLLDEADVLVAPSLQEGCSNVVLEAQARGLYCVVSESEGMKEVVENGVTGRICGRFADLELSQAIQDYQKVEFDERLRIARYTVDRIRRDFNREKQLIKWCNYFQYLCLNS
jgi:colanic acid/amylovoran biosynthesis glycosyltransferase